MTSPRLLEEIFEMLTEGVYFVDREGRITLWNAGAERVSGYARDEVMGRRCSDNLLKHVDVKGNLLCLNGCPLKASIGDGRQRKAQVFLHHKDGHRVPISVKVAPVRNDQGEITGAIEIFTDESDRMSILKELEATKKVALSDSLTGIGNRRFGEMALESAFHSFEEQEIAFGVLMIDIDHFKVLNDTYGHAVGDRALQMVAKTASNAVRRLDSLCRWGGEEFLVVSRCVDDSRLRSIAERIRVLVEGSWLDVAPRQSIVTSVSVGCAMVTAGDAADSLIARADSCLYEAKAGGRNRVVG